MKYVLDISCLDKYSSGAKQRFLNFYTELIKSEKKKNFLIIYTTKNNIKKFYKFPNVSFKKNLFAQDNYIKKLISIIYLTFLTKITLKEIRAIEFFTLPFVTLRNSINIITIHDLRKIFFSNFFINKFFLKFFYKFFLKKTNKVIVVSEAVKDEILHHFGEMNVSVIYNTIDENFFSKIKKEEITKVEKKYKLKKNFILSVGHQEKRKNFVRLIKAIYILKKDIPNIQLVIIGQKADETSKISKLILDLNLSQNIKIFDNLNDFEVRCFYKLSDMFVFPSIYEGFGIPILESMASGLPMVLSNTKIFREITENKYLYFDEFDPLSISNKIKFALNENKLKKKMISYGYKRVKYFRLISQKKKIINLYNNLS